MRERRIETAVKTAIYRRNYRRVRDRALTRLSRLYPDDYARLFAEERERDELEGKKWIDIGDSAIPGVAGTFQSESRATASSYREGDTDQSNLEGEE